MSSRLEIWTIDQNWMTINKNVKKKEKEKKRKKKKHGTLNFF